ncbi:MAG: hypothetical protein JWM78_2433 [Verrucomicrobiaceae bacterium]|nr:hypothetical protein [Verrucomicrobiaceae bacterium]
MKKRLIGSAIASSLLLIACGNKQDANETNFSAAIIQHLDKEGGLCLRLNKWPVDLTEMDLRFQKTIPTATAGQMDALGTIGLVSGADAEVDQMDMFGKPTGHKFKVKRYDLTGEGKKFYREKEVDQTGMGGSKKVIQGDICYGKKLLDTVVKWEGPMKFGDYQEANVKYLYKIDGLADWAKKPELQSAFPYIAQTIDAAGKNEQQLVVKLTSLGWEAKGLY